MRKTEKNTSFAFVEKEAIDCGLTITTKLGVNFINKNNEKFKFFIPTNY